MSSSAYTLREHSFTFLALIIKKLQIMKLYLVIFLSTILNICAFSQKKIELKKLNLNSDEDYKRYIEKEVFQVEKNILKIFLKSKTYTIDITKTREKNFGLSPKFANSFFLSPDKSYFIAFREGESGVKRIFFYTVNGKLMCVEEVELYPRIQFSPNGNRVAVFNAFGKNAYIFDRFGQLETKIENYQQLTNDKSAPLNYVCVSDNGNYIFLNSSKSLFMNKSLELTWTKYIPYVYDAVIFEDEKVLSIKHKVANSDAKNLSLIDSDKGSILAEYENISLLNFEPTSVTFKMNKSYYEIIFNKK